MKRFLPTATFVLLLAFGGAANRAQQVSQQPAVPQPPAAPQYPAGWAGKEFNEPAPNIQGAETLINEVCQPKSLDGIEIFIMQKGHDQPINLHVYCREDKAASAQYKLNAVPVVGHRLGAALNPQLEKPNSRIVGFFFGPDGKDDLLLAIEKVK